MTHKIPKIYQDQEVAYCGKCKHWKPKQDFHKDAGKTSGVARTCKVCKAAWRAANSEYLKQKASEWWRNNRERSAQTHREWVKNNPEKVRAYRKNHYKRLKFLKQAHP